MITHEELYGINPDLTPEVLKQVDQIIDQYKNKRGALIPVLEECQRVTGYLPVELQDYIAYGLNVPGSTVYGVVTFYSFFSMVPRGRHLIKVCIGTACYVRGGKNILERISEHYGLDVGGITKDRRFSLDAVRCLGACGLAPTVVVDENIYANMTPDRILEILEAYK